jgi:hypothetical protein
MENLCRRCLSKIPFFSVILCKWHIRTITSVNTFEQSVWSRFVLALLLQPITCAVVGVMVYLTATGPSAYHYFTKPEGKLVHRGVHITWHAYKTTQSSCRLVILWPCQASHSYLLIVSIYHVVSVLIWKADWVYTECDVNWMCELNHGIRISASSRNEHIVLYNGISLACHNGTYIITRVYVAVTAEIIFVVLILCMIHL